MLFIVTQVIYTNVLNSILTQPAIAVDTPTSSLQRCKTVPTSVRLSKRLTLNHLMMRLQ